MELARISDGQSGLEGKNSDHDLFDCLGDQRDLLPTAVRCMATSGRLSNF